MYQFASSFRLVVLHAGHMPMDMGRVSEKGLLPFLLKKILRFYLMQALWQNLCLNY